MNVKLSVLASCTCMYLSRVRGVLVRIEKQETFTIFGDLLRHCRSAHDITTVRGVGTGVGAGH